MVELRRTEALWALVAKNTFVGFLTAAVFWQEGDVRTGILSIEQEGKNRK